MARRPRLFVANIPYHIVQRGNNKNSIFFKEEDYLFFMDVLDEAKEKYPCLIYAYCLMVNHFHLLLEPKDKKCISSLMKLVGAKYVYYVNKFYMRTGTLWEGRFKGCFVDRESYFLSCLRYIEMNPVRAGIVSSPELYRWSSYRVRAFGEKSKIVDLDPWYLSLGAVEKTRQLSYRHLFQEAAAERREGLIKEMTAKNGIVGSAEFKKTIDRLTGQEIIFRKPGRPKVEQK